MCWLQSYHTLPCIKLSASWSSWEPMHTSMGFFSHGKLMLTMGLQLVLVVYSNLPHAGSHWTLQTSKIPHHWCAASARMGCGGCSAQSTWIRMVSSNATGANSVSGEKRPGMIKGQNEKGEFNIVAGRRKHYRSQCFPREIRWWFLACWRIWAEVLYLLLTLSHFNPFFFLNLAFLMLFHAWGFRTKQPFW